MIPKVLHYVSTLCYIYDSVPNPTYCPASISFSLLRMKESCMGKTAPSQHPHPCMRRDKEPQGMKHKAGRNYNRRNIFFIYVHFLPQGKMAVSVVHYIYLSFFLVFNLSTCTAEIFTIHCICSPFFPPSRQHLRPKKPLPPSASKG